MRYRIILLVAAASISLTGCATVYNEAMGRKEVTFFSTKQEIGIGNSVDKQIRNQYKVSGNAVMQARLKVVGDSLARRGRGVRVGRCSPNASPSGFRPPTASVKPGLLRTASRQVRPFQVGPPLSANRPIA